MPTVTWQNSYWAYFSLMGPDWTDYHRSSTSALIRNLCEMKHYQLKGSVSLCLLTPTRSPNRSELSLWSIWSSSVFSTSLSDNSKSPYYGRGLEIFPKDWCTRHIGHTPNLDIKIRTNGMGYTQDSKVYEA